MSNIPEALFKGTRGFGRVDAGSQALASQLVKVPVTMDLSKTFFPFLHDVPFEKRGFD